MNNRFWFQLHGWFSLPVWIVFCFICLTGTVAVISHEITWLLNPSARAENPTKIAALSIAEQVARLQEQRPTADISSVMTFESYLVTAVSFSDHDKPFAIAYVNPYSGEIQEINDGLTFIGFMRSLHGWLLFPWQQGYSVGYYLVCAMALVMLGALITGLIVYKKFWRSFISPKIRFNQGKVTLLADLHRLGGVWALWFMLLMSATGLWYLTQAILWHAEIDIEPHAPVIASNELPIENTPTSKTVGQVIEIAQQQQPSLKPTYVMFPEHNRGMYQIMGSGDHVFYDNYSYTFHINPWTGNVASQLTPKSMNTLQTIMHVADPLHYGTIGGIWTKLIWFIFGAILTAMSITGFMMWSERLLKAGRKTT